MLSYLSYLPGCACCVCQDYLNVQCAQLLGTEPVGGKNVITSGFVASYFSPGSARVIHPSACSPLLGYHLRLNTLAHQRGVWGTARTPEM